MPERKIELSAFINHVADEIRKARAEASREEKVLELAECEIEMALEVQWEAGGGIKVWVFDLAGKRNKSDSSTVRLRFGALGVLAFPGRQGGEGPELGRDQ